MIAKFYHIMQQIWLVTVLWDKDENMIGLVKF